MNAQEATQTNYCLWPNCTNESRSSRGAYAYCDDHRGKALDPEPAKNGAVAVRKEQSIEAKLRALALDARNIDRLFLKAEKLEAQAADARKQAVKAEREFKREAAAVLDAS